jgi:hypothetical protein
MTNPIFSVEVDAADTRIRSSAFDVNHMMSVEGSFERRTRSSSPLKQLYDCWTTTSYFDPLRYGHIWIQYIDTYAESPLAYVWYRHTGLTFGDLSGREVGSLPYPLLRRECEQEYATIKRLGCPIYHHINQTVEGIHREYTRLMIPGSNDVIYYTFRLITPPTSVDESIHDSASVDDRIDLLRPHLFN